MTSTPERGLPPYARVVADIRARIDSGELHPGDRIPSTREITREWGVAMATATKALAALRQEGLVEAVRGVGTVVRGAPDPAPATEPYGPQGRRERPRPAAGGSPRRAPSETALSKEAIVRTAIAIADAEGIDGLSMRRVSIELRVSTMALYRHITGKSELVSEMLDRVYTERALPEPPPSGWRRALETALLAEWDIYRRHPWAIRLTMVSGGVHSPGLLQNGEWMMKVIAAQGHSPDGALQILTLLSAYTSGMALQATRAVVEEDEVGMDAEHWWMSRAQELRQIAEEGRFPTVFSVSGPPDVDAIFELGMKHLLDGLTPLIESGS